MSYAETTSVSVERSKMEIESTLKRYGADDFQAGWSNRQGVAVVAFSVAGRHVRFKVQVPDKNAAEFTRTETGRERKQPAAFKAWEQSQRQRWRALLLVIKAKLEAIEAGVETLEEAFLAQLVIPGGGTVADQLVPEILEAIEGGRVPPLLLHEGSR